MLRRRNLRDRRAALFIGAASRPGQDLPESSVHIGSCNSEQAEEDYYSRWQRLMSTEAHHPPPTCIKNIQWSTIWQQLKTTKVLFTYCQRFSLDYFRARSRRQFRVDWRKLGLKMAVSTVMYCNSYQKRLIRVVERVCRITTATIL